MKGYLDLGLVIEDLYNKYIVSVYDKSKLMGIYQAYKIIDFDKDKLSLASSKELKDLIMHGKIRFTQVINPNNYLDLPVRKLKAFIKSAIVIGQDEKFVDRNTLDIEGIYGGIALIDPVTICVHKIDDESDEVRVLSDITNIDKEEKIKENSLVK